MLPDVSPADLSALLLDIQAQGRAHSTAVKVYTVLHTLFKMAYLSDMIPRNPMDKVARPVPRKDEIRETEAQALTLEELRAQGYQAFYIAIGCQGGRKTGVPGEEGSGWRARFFTWRAWCGSGRRTKRTLWVLWT